MKYLVDIRESERGWGSDTWTETYDTLKEAQARYDDLMKQYGGQASAPDYYCIPLGPVREEKE